jgi:thiol:disulfide interchange protein DsbD
VKALALVLVLALAAGAAQAGGATSPGAAEAAIARSVTAGRPVLLEFTADWCGGCRALAKDLRALRATVPCADLVVVDLSAGPGNAAARALTRHFRLDGLPTLAFLDADGFERWRLTGTVGADPLRERLAGAC